MEGNRGRREERERGKRADKGRDEIGHTKRERGKRADTEREGRGQTKKEK